jgi:hypothetical protein
MTCNDIVIRNPYAGIVIAHSCFILKQNASITPKNAKSQKITSN